MSDKDLGYIKGTLDALIASHSELKITLNNMINGLKNSQEIMEQRVDKMEQHISLIESIKNETANLKKQVNFLYRGYYVTLGAATVIMFVWSIFKDGIIKFFTER